MSTSLAVVKPDAGALALSDTRDFVTMSIAGQMFGIPVLLVNDVLGPQKITRVPLAPAEVAGSLNLRGRIVTAVDLRKRLGLPPSEDIKKPMSIVVEHDGEFYSLMVDQVGEVMSLPQADYEKNPVTLEERWREVCDGVYRLESGMLIVLDIRRLLRFDGQASVAKG